LIDLLHVEDDPDIREIAELALSLSGKFKVTQCPDGPEALKTLETLRPDIILMDMMMPGMTGVQLLEHVRQIEHLKQVPIVFMTARVLTSEVQGLLDCGAVGVIVKPFNPITLGDQIETFYLENRAG
jgi:CheY-like chemotaxis protein